MENVIVAAGFFANPSDADIHAAEPNRTVHSQGSLIKERKAEPAVHISWNDAVQCAIPRAVQHVGAAL